MIKHLVRKFEDILDKRLQEKPRHIQVVMGPRQVGKTSGAVHLLESKYKKQDWVYLTCEEGLHGSEWLLQQVQKAQQANKKIIVFDEIQKINQWSEFVKLAWDQQKRQKNLMHWILLGSSSLKLSQGLSDSLSGRFEIIQVSHWDFTESKKMSSLNLNDYLHWGGYPGAYAFRNDPKRMRQYLMDSIFETVVSQDILRFATVKKPALFRQVFMLASHFPAQEVSYNKLLGQLQDAGNVDQIKHYLDLFSQAFLIRLVFKYSKAHASKTSSPKLLPSAPVFTALFLNRELTQEELGRVFEASVGNRLCENFSVVYFWREGVNEVDYVIETTKGLIGIEVKSKRRKTAGLSAFRKKFLKSRCCIIDFENYIEFEKNPEEFIEKYSI
ncbi:MAG: ATP-binding protein [Pseudobdellovibrio sp.]